VTCFPAHRKEKSVLSKMSPCAPKNFSIVRRGQGDKNPGEKGREVCGRGGGGEWDFQCGGKWEKQEKITLTT